MKIKKIIALFVGFVMLISMAISTSALETQTEGTIHGNIVENATNTIVARTTYHLKYYANVGCIKAQNTVSYKSASIGISERYFTGYVVLTYTMSGVVNGETMVETCQKHAIKHMLNNDRTIEIYHYLPAGYVYKNVKATFYTNYNIAYENTVYYGNPNYSTFTDEIILTMT